MPPIPLSPSGSVVRLPNGVSLRTPGLQGLAEAHRPSTDGMRGAEEASAALLQALAATSISEQVTVEITRQSERGSARAGSRAAGGPDDIELTVPGAGAEFGQFLLFTGEDGSLSWHLPEPTPGAIAGADTITGPAATTTATAGGARAGGSVTFRVPRTISPVPPAAGGTDRGLIGALGKKLLKVLVFPLLDPILGAVGHGLAAAFEQHARRNLLRRFTPDDYRGKEATFLSRDDHRRLAEGPALFFVHGTLSSSHGGFGSIPPDLFRTLFDRYQGRVFAFDHFTLSMTPSENVEWLASQLPDRSRLQVDVIAHSRGGLVARALAEQPVTLGVGQRMSVRNLVMVASPNAGTALADADHLKSFMDRLTGLLQFVPDNGVTDVLENILTVLKQIVVGAFKGIDGLMSMNPKGSWLQEFNAVDSSANESSYHAVGADYDPPQGSPLIRIARDGVTDLVFGRAGNDLVVPTLGVFEVPGASRFPIAAPLRFDQQTGITHSTYWNTPELRSRLLEWLPG